MIDFMNPRIQQIVIELTEIFGAAKGYGHPDDESEDESDEPDFATVMVDLFGGGSHPEDVLDDVHRIWEKYRCTAEDKKAVFEGLYGVEALKEIEAAAGVTVAEIRMMMVECDVDTFTIRK